MKRAAHCDDCKHFHVTLHPSSTCSQGHKPRFYAPKTISQATFGWYGWKRKCEDFVKEESHEPKSI